MRDVRMAQVCTAAIRPFTTYCAERSSWLTATRSRRPVDDDPLGLAGHDRRCGEPDGAGDAAAVAPHEGVEAQLLRPERRHQALAVVALRPVRHEAVDLRGVDPGVLGRRDDGAQA